MRSVRLALSAAVVFAPAPAFAQAVADASRDAAQAQAQAPDAQVTVTARARPVTRKIDRIIYRPGANLQSAHGSASDILKELPSVDVDSDGNVSIRGDSNVTILIDGRPSAQMNADRAAALENLSASQIDHIEVSDNPSADQKADGSGGIINIVTKKTSQGGVTGAGTASVGDQGRKNGGFNVSRREGNLTLYGGLTVRYDVRKQVWNVLTDTGEFNKNFRTYETRTLSPTLTGGADFNLTKTDQLHGSFSYSNRSGASFLSERNQTFDSLAGPPVGAFDRNGREDQRLLNTDYLATWRHSFPGDDHTLEIALHQTESDGRRRGAYTQAFPLPPSPDQIDDMWSRSDTLIRDVSLDYTRPLPGGAQLKTGYDFERDDDYFDNYDLFLAPTRGVNPELTNRFRYAQALHALYATWRRPFGKLTVLAGLRAEQAFIDLDEITTLQKVHIQYFRVYPSLHLEYALGPDQTLRASYTDRVVRPQPWDLDPFLTERDATDFRSGNPHLMPQETHSWEAAWSLNRGGITTAATVYWRHTLDAFAYVNTPITINSMPPQPAVLTTIVNLGRSSAGGIELSHSGKLWKGLSYNLDANIYYSEIDASNLGIAGGRSIVSFSAQGDLNWKPDADDTFQVSGFALGKRLTAEGWQEPDWAVNLGWRRNLSPNLTVTATVTDVFNTDRNPWVIVEPGLHETFTHRQLGRNFYIGFTRRFGGGGKADEKFNYSDQGD